MSGAGGNNVIYINGQGYWDPFWARLPQRGPRLKEPTVKIEEVLETKLVNGFNDAIGIPKNKPAWSARPTKDMIYPQVQTSPQEAPNPKEFDNTNEYKLDKNVDDQLLNEFYLENKPFDISYETKIVEEYSPTNPNTKPLNETHRIIPEKKVYVTRNVINKIKNETLKYLDIETGGALFGIWDHDGNAYVYGATGPGKDAKRTPTSFVMDDNLLLFISNNITSQFGHIGHIGSWHSHHKIDLNTPSTGDTTTIVDAIKKYQIGSFLAIISTISNNNNNINVIPYIYTKEKGIDYERGKFYDMEQDIMQYIMQYIDGLENMHYNENNFGSKRPRYGVRGKRSKRINKKSKRASKRPRKARKTPKARKRSKNK
jgi:hypothetical protein